MGAAAAARRARRESKIGQTLPAICRPAPRDTPDTARLWDRHAQGDVAAFQDLCTHYAPLAFLHAWLLKARRPAFYVDDLDDLVGDALLSLTQLIQGTDGYRDPGSFRRVAKVHLRRAIKRGVENRWWKSRHAHSRSNVVRATRAKLTAEQGRVPTRDELTDALAGVIANPNFYTAHKPRLQAIGKSAVLTRDESVRLPDDIAIDGELTRFAMKGLKGQERAMFRLMMNGLGAKEIGVKLGIPEEVTRRRLNGVLWTLRQRRDLAAVLGVEPAPRPTLSLSKLPAVSSMPPARRVG